MSEPKTKREHDARFREHHNVHHRIDDEPAHSLPCPFCAAPDFIEYKVDAAYIRSQMEAGGTCSQCGRSAKAIYKRPFPDMEMELVQTGGAPAPPWVHVRPA